MTFGETTRYGRLLQYTVIYGTVYGVCNRRPGNSFTFHSVIEEVEYSVKDKKKVLKEKRLF